MDGSIRATPAYSHGPLSHELAVTTAVAASGVAVADKDDGNDDNNDDDADASFDKDEGGEDGNSDDDSGASS